MLINNRKDVKMSSALNKMTVEDFDVKGKRVLVRCDFNVKWKTAL